MGRPKGKWVPKPDRDPNIKIGRPRKNPDAPPPKPRKRKADVAELDELDEPEPAAASASAGPSTRPARSAKIAGGAARQKAQQVLADWAADAGGVEGSAEALQLGVMRGVEQDEEWVSGGVEELLEGLDWDELEDEDDEVICLVSHRIMVYTVSCPWSSS